MHFGGVGVQTKCRFFAVLSTRFVDVVQQVIEDEKNPEVFAMFVWTLWYIIGTERCLKKPQRQELG